MHSEPFCGTFYWLDQHGWLNEEGRVGWFVKRGAPWTGCTHVRRQYTHRIASSMASNGDGKGGHVHVALDLGSCPVSNETIDGCYLKNESTLFVANAPMRATAKEKVAFRWPTSRRRLNRSGAQSSQRMASQVFTSEDDSS